MSTTHLTILEQAKRRELGNVARIAELLEQYNEFTVDAPIYEANDVYSHLFTRRTAQPTITPRSINQGAARSRSTTEQVREHITLLEVWAEIDEQLIDHEPSPGAARRNELIAFVEAGAQEFARRLVYGNPADGDARQFRGLTARYNTLGTPNVISIGGTGGTSVWLIEWGFDTAHLVHPKGSPGIGLNETDMGKIRVTDVSGNPFMAYVNQMKWEYGLVIKDDRAVQRLCNINVAGGANSLDNATRIRDMVRAKNRLPRMGRNAVIYAQRDTKSQFDIYALEKTNGFYMQSNITGGPLTMFQGIPIRMVEQLLTTEGVVT